MRCGSPLRTGRRSCQSTARLVEQHGRVLKEYIEVPGALLSNWAELQRLFAASHEYALSLKPKKTTR